MKERHPYELRTKIRMHLPWFLIRLGIANKAEDCTKIGAKHVWYNIDNENSGCYHCKVVKPGRLWRAEQRMPMYLDETTWHNTRKTNDHS